MQLLITGGLGFLGLQAARRFLQRSALWSPVSRSLRPLTQLTLFDLDFPDAPLPRDIVEDPRVRIKTGDITEEGVAAELTEEPDLGVIHLASMVSGDSEADPARAWQVNVEAQRVLLDSLSERAPGARFLFTSSTATFGPVDAQAPPPGDSTKQLPHNTYGFHKVVCELMLNEYTRRGCVDGRGLRLPIIVVRPGAPNKALTTCWSSAVRDPLNGVDASLPVPADSIMPVASYQTVVKAFEHLMLNVQSEHLGHDRTLTLPALSASPAQLYEAAGRLAEQRSIPLGKLREDLDETATRVVKGMGSSVSGDRAFALGLPQDESSDTIVQGFADDYIFGGVRMEQRP